MRLQQKIYGFSNKGDFKLLTSKLIVNGNETDNLLSSLFEGIKKERNNSIRGYSILEFLNEKGEIQINDKVYQLSFKSGDEVFSLSSITDPVDFILNDKEISESQEKSYETLIESSAPVQEPKQPKESETEETQAGAEETIIHENEDYNNEVKSLSEDGYKELNTNPKSNYRLLVRKEQEGDSDEQKEKNIILVEITEDDYNLLDVTEFKIEISEDNNFKISEND